MKNEFYEMLCEEGAALIDGEPNMVANLSNAAALLGERLENINWAGFYLMDHGQLVLGPFWGKPACLRIAPGRGVCGTAVQKDENLRVEDVHDFAGHIACDAASASEIVLPLHRDGRVIGVLDIDSPVTARFTQQDEQGLDAFARVIEKGCCTGVFGYDLK